MAISTYKTFLMHSTDGNQWTKLLDIKNFPKLGGEPEAIEITTLSDRMKRFIPGLENSENLPFKANYDSDDYDRVDALRGKTEHYAVWFGGTEEGGELTPTGEFGKFEFDGEARIYVEGGETNNPVEMTVTIVPSTEIRKASDAV